MLTSSGSMSSFSLSFCAAVTLFPKTARPGERPDRYDSSVGSPDRNGVRSRHHLGDRRCPAPLAPGRRNKSRSAGHSRRLAALDGSGMTLTTPGVIEISVVGMFAYVSTCPSVDATPVIGTEHV